MEQQQNPQQPLQMKVEKRPIRMGAGLLRNSVSLQKSLNKTYVPLIEQNNGNSPATNYFVSSTNLPLSQITEQPNQSSGFHTQSGFFKRKTQVKMSTNGIRTFSTLQHTENPAVLSVRKLRFAANTPSSLNSIISSGSPQQQQILSTHNVQPNPFSSPNIQHSASLPIGIKNESSTFLSAFNQWSNNNQDVRRSLISPSKQPSIHESWGVKKEFQGSFHRARTAMFTFDKKQEREKQQQCNEQISSKEQYCNKESHLTENKFIKNDSTEEVKEEQDSYEDSQAIQRSIMQGNNANYSHNTESTNATSAQIHSVSQNVVLDASRSKAKLGIADYQEKGKNSQVLKTKKKIQEAKEFSNQVRQQIFEIQDQEEEENFLKLCETLNIASN